jgi:Mg-chelatase subunit ChlD
MKSWMLAVVMLACADPRQGTVRKPGTVVTADADTAQESDTTAAVDTAPEPIPLVECGRQLAEVAGRADASVLLVMDRSRSMAQGSKWAQTRAAVEVALSEYERYLRFGLLMYPTESDVCDAVDPRPDVPIALENGQAIASAMADAEILRGTPTGPALRAAAELFASDASPNRVVILATDGRPDCTGAGWDNEGTASASEAYDAANDLAEGGIPVYVVGIQGSDSARAVLNRIAEVGGTAKPGATGYYETNGGPEMAQALIDIALDVDGCMVTLDEHADAVRMDVHVDGRAMGSDGVNGWELVDGRLRMNGTSCLALDGETHRVEVVWYCEPADAVTIDR